jgi:thioester reductase-like protein
MIAEQAKEMGMQLRVSSVFSSPTIMQLVEQQGLNDLSTEETSDGANNSNADIFKQVKEETMTLSSRLSDIYKASNLSQESLTNFSLQTILLTGSTGFLGAHILHELLTSTTICKIFCLIRSKNTGEAFKKLSNSLSNFGLLSSDIETAIKERCELVCGDLSDDRFGLDTALYDSLKEVSCIVHAAASINHMNSYDSMKRTNVHGTYEVLRLSVSGEESIPVFHMSTVSVFASGKSLILESDDCADELEHMEVGYTQTKWAAEQLCANAQKEGLPVSVFRVGNIAASLRTDGTSASVVWQRNTYLSAQYAASVKLGMLIWDEDEEDTSSDEGQPFIDITPVNFAASCVVHAVRSVGSSKVDLWGNFHLSDVHPGARVDAVVDSLKEAGKSIKKVSFSTFADELSKAIKDCTDSDDRNAFSLLQSLLEWYGSLKSGEGLQKYDCGRLMSLLSDSDIKPPHFGKKEILALMESAKPFAKGASIN